MKKRRAWIPATAEEVRAISDRTHAMLVERDRLVEEDELDPWEEPDGTDVAVEALRFCAMAASALRDPSLLDVVADAVDVIYNLELDTLDHGEVASSAISELLRAGAPVDDVVEALAEHDEPAVRASVASGLSPKTPEGLTLLRTLAADSSPSVRSAAKERLGAENAPPWWAGKFASDPLARLSSEQAKSLEASLRTVAELLDGGRVRQSSDEARLLGALKKLPDDMAIEACEAGIQTADAYLIPVNLLRHLLTRKGFVAPLWRWLETAQERSQSYQCRNAVKEALKALAPSLVERILLELADVCARASRDDRADIDSLPSLIAQVVEETWPVALSIAPIAERILALAASNDAAEGDDRRDYVMSTLGRAIKKSSHKKSVLAAVEAILKRWIESAGKSIGPVAEDVEERAAELPVKKLRALVDDALRSKRDEVAGWALNLLFGRAYDAKRDGDKVELARRLFGDDRMRRVASLHAADIFLPMLREKLRAGELDAPAAASTLQAIRRLWNDGSSRPSDRDSDRIAELGPLLGPRALRGKITDEEWSAWRRVRLDFIRADHHNWRAVLMLLPRTGARHPEDRALIAQALEVYRNQDEWVGAQICEAVRCTPEVGDLEILEELKRAKASYVVHFAKEARAAILAALGMPPDQKEDEDAEDAGVAPGAPKSELDEWLDSDD